MSLVLVTGGAGFIGRSLVHQLLAHGERVRILDRVELTFENVPAGAHVEAVRGDITSAADVAAAVRGCREVYHIAAIPHLWIKPRGLYRRVNFLGAANVMDVALQAGARRIVHVSSDTISDWCAGTQSRNTGQPHAPWRVIGSYCRAKYLAERHALALANRGKEVVIAAPTVPIGPGDWQRSPPTRMLLDFFHGGRAEYTDGNINLVDVHDVAEGLMRAMVHGRPGRRYLLGNENLTLRELFSRLAQISGLPEPTRRIPVGVALAAGYVSEWIADVITHRPPLATVLGVKLTQRPVNPNARADLEELGVRPRSIDESLRETLAWFREIGWLSGGNVENSK